MRSHPWILIALVLTPVLSARAAEYAFRADFEDGIVGNSVPSSPAGDPVGDTIVVADTAPGTITIQENLAGRASKYVLMDRSVGTGTFSVRCYLDPTQLGARRMRIRWKSNVLSTPFGLFVTLRGGAYLMGSVQYRREGELTYGSSVNTLEAQWSPNVWQQFEWLLDFDDEVTRLWIDGVEVALPFTMSDPAVPIDRVSFEMSGQGLDDFAFDDVEVLIEDANVSTNTSSWGELKAGF